MQMIADYLRRQTKVACPETQRVASEIQEEA